MFIYFGMNDYIVNEYFNISACLMAHSRQQTTRNMESVDFWRIQVLWSCFLRKIKTEPLMILFIIPYLFTSILIL